MTDHSPPSQPGARLRRSLDRLRTARERHGGGTPTRRERSLETGASGELLVGQALEIAAESVGGVAVLQSLGYRGRLGDIDHVVIGPAGVLVIDTKTWNGRVQLNDKGLWAGRFCKTAELDGLAAQCRRVKLALDAAGNEDVLVEGALCLVNGARGLDGTLGWFRGQAVGRINPVARHAVRPGSLDRDRVAELSRALRNAFDVSGGCFEPAVSAVAPSAPPPGLVPPAARRARFPAPARWLIAGSLSLLLVASLLAVAGVLVSTISDSLEKLQPMTRSELSAAMPLARELARDEAGGPVKRVRVVTRPDQFVVTFRRGTRCRVTATYSRLGRMSRLPEVRAARCQPSGNR